jgi:uncharacterized protein (DUF736 family)
MATIGSFIAKDGKITGKIHTLALNASLTFLPNTSTGQDTPAYRVFSGRSEVGAAWQKTAESSGREYLSVRLDDPSFAAPIFANLIEQEDGTHELVWSRPRS